MSLPFCSETPPEVLNSTRGSGCTDSSVLQEKVADASAQPRARMSDLSPDPQWKSREYNHCSPTSKFKKGSSQSKKHGFSPLQIDMEHKTPPVCRVVAVVDLSRTWAIQLRRLNLLVPQEGIQESYEPQRGNSTFELPEKVDIAALLWIPARRSSRDLPVIRVCLQNEETPMAGVPFSSRKFRKTTPTPFCFFLHGDILWMDEILHLGNPGMVRFRCKYQQTFWFQPGLHVVARSMDFVLSLFHPSPRGG